MWNLLALALAAIVAGAINSIAGGGTLLTYPALYSALGATGMAAVIANATSTTALVPGGLAGAWGYRSEVGRLPRWVWLLLVPSIAGGICGSLLLVTLPAETFRVLVPWLILSAALLFAGQPHVTRWMAARAAAKLAAQGGERTISVAGPKNLAMVLTLQFFVSVYGGYFGAGCGILMLATFGFMGLDDIHEMNALKTLLGAVINGVSVAIFVAHRVIDWPLALLMAIAAIAGGYVGARIARRLNRDFVRNVVVLIGFVLATYYFYSQWPKG